MAAVRLGVWCFRLPGWLPLVATALMLALLLHLGSWQLQRSDYKKQRQQDFEAMLTAAPMALDRALDQKLVQYRRAFVGGHFDPSAAVLYLDNQGRGGRLGYEVFAVFLPADMERGLLVNLGWLPARADRRDLPKVSLPTEALRLSGSIYKPSANPFRLGEDEPPVNAHQWIVQALEPAALAKRLAKPLLPVTLRLSADGEWGQSLGFVRDWSPQRDPMTPEKHLGYAVQWFGLAAALLVIFLVVNTRKIAPS